MGITPVKRKRDHQISATGTAGLPPTTTSMDEEEEKQKQDDYYYYSSYQHQNTISELIFNCLVTLLSPLSFFSQSQPQVSESENPKESTVNNERSRSISSSILAMMRKLGVGFLGAVNMCMILTMVMGLAMILGVVLVHLWVEEPLCLRERLHFDYTHPRPNAVFSFRGGDRNEGLINLLGRRMSMGVPVGHTIYISLLLLLPDSDCNRDIGVFQLSAELISTNGHVIARSSQPCMLRFRSLPIRLMQTFIMGIPLLLGITAETQKIVVPMLKHNEGYPRTEAIRISLIPRAGTSLVPQLYEAEIIINSHLPWSKEIVRRWKWTFCVWVSIHIYIILVIILVCCFRPLIFPTSRVNYRDYRAEDVSLEVSKEPLVRGREEREISESLRRWQQSRSRRKAMLLCRALPETIVCSSASSISAVTREETVARTEEEEEDTGDSESVCFGG
ncbi:putative adipose-regulatory protein [Actinidia rufa]|uniref:Putative adipose-regulatory protein n=1 Tax=Actinidia rufa TaxID=165716 RepID=A0A7J0GUL8_9ERIC|nr:putative adipose-regulatory protein [Actinidia rufa]